MPSQVTSVALVIGAAPMPAPWQNKFAVVYSHAWGMYEWQCEHINALARQADVSTGLRIVQVHCI